MVLRRNRLPRVEGKLGIARIVVEERMVEGVTEALTELTDDNQSFVLLDLDSLVICTRVGKASIQSEVDKQSVV